MSPSAGDDASAPPPRPSSKALGKRKQVNGDDETASRTKAARPPPGPKANTWESQPTGPWCNPRSLGRPQTFKRIDEYYLAPRAWTLPYSKSFVDQLTKDVDELLAAFETAWHAHADELKALKDVLLPSRKGKQRQQQLPTVTSPLALFVDAWKQRGWHLISLTWGEDERTRAAFFESTTRLLLEASRHTTTHRSVGCLFALLLLYTCQTRWPDPLPGVKYEAFNWARPDANDDEWNPHSRRGINAIKIEGDIHAELLALVDKVNLEMRFSPDVEAHIKRLYPPSDATLATEGALHDVSYALSELDRRQAWQILPSSKLLQGGRNPPFLPLYEEIDEEEKIKRQAEWGRLVEWKEEGGSSKGPQESHPLSRSDVLLVRAADALGVPLKTVFTWLGDGEDDAQEGHPSTAAGTSPRSRRRQRRVRLEYDDRRPDGKDQTEHRMTTKWGNVWLEKPFRPMELPRVSKWLGGDAVAAATAKGKLAELDEEIEVYMQLVGDLVEEPTGGQGSEAAAACSSATM